MTAQQYIEHIQKFYQPEDVIACHIWGIDDVFDWADRNDLLHPSVEEAEEVILRMDKYCDSEYGITWYHLEQVLQDVLEKREVSV